MQLDFVLSDAVADLIDERIDVAFRGGGLPDSSLVARRLATGRLSLVEVTGRFSANTMQARLKAVLAGLGIGLLPDTLMQQSLSAGRLVQVLPGHEQSGGGFHVV